jgi:hypothetical protein
MDYKEFKDLKAAQKVLAELDIANGFPIQGNSTQTSAEIEEINGLFYIVSYAFDKVVDTSKAVDVKIVKELKSDNTITKTKTPK